MDGILCEYRLSEQPNAVYASVISKESLSLELPDDCFTDIDSTSFVLTNSYMKGCICLFQPDSFEDVKERLNRLNVMDAQSRCIKRRIVGCAEMISVDTNRRMNINPVFMETIGFGSIHSDVEIVILKFSNRIEIVSRTLYEDMFV